MVSGLLEEVVSNVAEPVPNVAEPVPNVAEPAPREVTSQETVKGQIAGILDEESPILTTARTRAKEKSAERGLQNTSMAVQAGEQAVIESALPIAQQDAETFAQSAQSAQESGQRMAETAFTGELSKDISEHEYGLKEELVATEYAEKQELAEAENKFVMMQNEALAKAEFELNQMLEQGRFDVASLQEHGQSVRQELELASSEYIAKLDLNSQERQAAMASAESIGQQYQVALQDIATSDLSSSAKHQASLNARTTYSSTLQASASIANIDIAWENNPLQVVV